MIPHCYVMQIGIKFTIHNDQIYLNKMRFSSRKNSLLESFINSPEITNKFKEPFSENEKPISKHDVIELELP